MILDAAARQAVARTIREHCRVRKWILHAINCRTQHVHVVVTAVDRNPDDVMVQFKAWCTKMLKQQARKTGAESARTRWWTEGGSKRYVYENNDLEAVITYVTECQDKPRNEGIETVPG